MVINSEEHSRISALVLEDNPGDYVLVEDYLIEKFKGIEINHCTDCKSAVEYLQNEEHKTSIILLDLNLPDMIGLELIQKILSFSYHTPIIILTGYSDLPLAKKSLQLGVYDFLVKDEVNPTLLHKSIEFAINRRSYVKQIEDEKLNYENTFSLSPQPMWVYESDTLKFLDVNDSAIQHYGYSRDEFLNLSIDQIRSPSEIETLKDVLEKSRNNEKRVYYGKFLHRKKSGVKIIVDIYSNYIRFGDLNARLVLANDITERENHLKSIQKQNKILREIAWTQSHTLRAPLARMMGLVEYIMLKGSADEEFQEMIQHINTSAQELDEIVQNIVNKSNSIKI